MQQEEGRWSSSHCHGVALTRDSFSLKTQGGTPEDTKTASVPQGVLLGLEGQPPGPLLLAFPLSPSSLSLSVCLSVSLSLWFQESRVGIQARACPGISSHRGHRHSLISRIVALVLCS